MVALTQEGEGVLVEGAKVTPLKSPPEGTWKANKPGCAILIRWSGSSRARRCFAHPMGDAAGCRFVAVLVVATLTAAGAARSRGELGERLVEGAEHFQPSSAAVPAGSGSPLFLELARLTRSGRLGIYTEPAPTGSTYRSAVQIGNGSLAASGRMVSPRPRAVKRARRTD